MVFTQQPVARTAVDAIRRFWREHRRMPSYSELAALCGFSSKNAAYRLSRKLIAEGYLEAGPGGRLRPRSEKMGLPLVGAVQAGFPSPAEEQVLNTLSLDDYLIHNHEASFLLRVSGDSMIDAGIMPDDLVIIERGGRPKNGDIIVAHIDGEWTLKYYQRNGSEVTLVPANAKYPVLKPQHNLNLGGIVRGVVRKY